MMRFDNINIKTGVRLHYATQGSPSGEPIILLHGYPDSWWSYSRVLPLFRPDYRIYAPDQRGHGDSERPPSGYGIPNLAADILAFMDANETDQATVVGHSMGSFVAQHVAAAAAERVKQLVLVGSAATLHNDVVSQLHKDVNALSDPIPEKFVRDFQQSTFVEPVPEEFFDRVIIESLKPPARVWQAVVNGFLRPEANADFSKITMPTLIMWGEKDSIFSRPEQDALISALPQAVFKEYSETGHNPQWERPEEFVKDLEEFMMKNKG